MPEDAEEEEGERRKKRNPMARIEARMRVMWFVRRIERAMAIIFGRSVAWYGGEFAVTDKKGETVGSVRAENDLLSERNRHGQRIEHS